MDIPDSNINDRISIWNEYMDGREITKSSNAHDKKVIICTIKPTL